MGTRIAQFDSLLSGYLDPNTGLVGAGYTVYFYAAGTTTAKDVWTAYDKTGGAVTSVTLDATGSALVFGDGVYKLVVKNLSAATVDTFDGVKVQAGGYNVVSSTAATLTVTTDMDAVLLDCTSTNQVVTLPLASTATRPIFFKRTVAGSTTITLLPTSPDLLDGAASYVALTTLNADVTFISDGANWYGQNSGALNATTLNGYSASLVKAAGTIPVSNVSAQLVSDLLGNVTGNATGTAAAGTGDNAVTLAMMEHGAQGDILYYAAAGAPTRLGTGTAGQFLKAGGAGANPAWATIGATEVTAALVGSAVAGLALGAVGSHAYLSHATSNTAVTAGTSYAGSSFVYSSIAAIGADSLTVRGSGAAPSGTWMALGTGAASSGYYVTTLFKRTA